MQAEGHRAGRSRGVCRKHPSRAEGRVLTERENSVCKGSEAWRAGGWRVGVCV